MHIFMFPYILYSENTFGSSTNMRSFSSVHGLTVQNVPKSVDFHTINECNSSTITTTCRISLTILRCLANKRSESQSTYLSHKIHSSNGTKSGFHTKSKEVRVDTNTAIHIYGYGISNSAGSSQSTSGPSESCYSDHQNNSLSDSGFGTNFSFLFWANSVQQQI